MLGQYAAPGAIMVDGWGLSEQGVALSSTEVVPASTLDSKNTKYTPFANIQTPPGCAGKGMPGMGVHCVDDDGNDVPRGEMGNVVLSLPLSPSSLNTLWHDEERFYSSYLKRFKGKWFDTGDAGCITKDGYVEIWSRSDDVINVAGHRLSTGETYLWTRHKHAWLISSSGAIEQAISAHPAVVECCVIGFPDELKGHLPFAFIVTYSAQNEAELFQQTRRLVREQQGSISSLGGLIAAKQGENLIPKTRTGKMLRRNLRELLDNAVRGNFEKEVQAPAVSVHSWSVTTLARINVLTNFPLVPDDRRPRSHRHCPTSHQRLHWKNGQAGAQRQAIDVSQRLKDCILCLSKSAHYRDHWVLDVIQRQ